MKFLLSILLISAMSFLSCKSADKPFTPVTPIEKLAVDLFEVIKKKDFNAFEKLVAEEKNIKNEAEAQGENFNTSREDRKRIFDSFYEKDIPWDKMKIKNVTAKERGRETMKFAKVIIKFSGKKSNCTLDFPNWIKPRGSSWKLGSLPPEITFLSKL